MTAARTGRVEAIQVLLDHGANINARETVRGQTALMWAVLENHPAVVRLLISRGADVNAQTDTVVPDGTTGVPQATSGDIGAHGPGIYRSRAVPSPSGAMTALLFAARDGDLEMARILTVGKRVLEKPVCQRVRVHWLRQLPTTTSNWPVPAREGSRPQRRRPLLQADAALRRGRDAESGLHARYRPPVPDKRDPMDLIKALLANGANPNARVNTTPFRGFYQVSANWVNFDGQTPSFALRSPATSH